MGMSEIDSDSGVFGQGLVFAHLTALVEGHGKAHLAFKAFEDLAKAPRDRVGLPVGQLHQGDKEALALHQGAYLRKVSLANNEVSFPVARNQSFVHFCRPSVDQGHLGNGVTASALAPRRSARLVSAAQQIQHAGAELSPWHGIECRVDGLMGKTDRLSHTCQCARNLHRTQASAKMSQHGHPKPVAGFQLSRPTRLNGQHTGSSISGYTAVDSSNAALAQLRSTSVALNLTGYGRTGSLQLGCDPGRPPPMA